MFPGDEAEVDNETELDIDDYEEEDPEPVEQTMSLSQMLNQHRDDDNYYGYDDEDYWNWFISFDLMQNNKGVLGFGFVNIKAVVFITHCDQEEQFVSKL